MSTLTRAPPSSEKNKPTMHIFFRSLRKTSFMKDCRIRSPWNLIRKRYFRNVVFYKVIRLYAREDAGVFFKAIICRAIWSSRYMISCVANLLFLMVCLDILLQVKLKDLPEKLLWKKCWTFHIKIVLKFNSSSKILMKNYIKWSNIIWSIKFPAGMLALHLEYELIH